jgi:hypothetical protein
MQNRISHETIKTGSNTTPAATGSIAVRLNPSFQKARHASSMRRAGNSMRI